MADYMTTTEKWTCPDCGAAQWEIVPTGCNCTERDTCACGETMEDGAEFCPDCTALLNCSGCGCSIDLYDAGECIVCWERRIGNDLMRTYLTTEMSLREYMKKMQDVRQIVADYPKNKADNA